jgi:DNA-binding transcriptional LysR family regulator
MDLSALKTFLEVAKTRHFGDAADTLCVSQSAVSARIKSLEDALGVELFVRQRGNIQLTVAGEALANHAKSMMKLWARAQQEINVGSGNRETLSVGGLPGLWDITLQDWLYSLSNSHPNLLISADIFSRDTLYNGVLDGTLDVAFLYDAPHGVNLVAAPLKNICLRLVSAKNCDTLPDGWFHDFIQVDWGTNYSVEFAAQFPEATSVKMSTGIARIAQEFLLRGGGYAYLAEPAVAKLVKDGLLFYVPDRPVFKRQAFAIYHQENIKSDLIQELIEHL